MNANRTWFWIPVFLVIGPAATAADPLGIYVGGSAGQADVRASIPFRYGGTYDFDAHHLGWTAFVGIRPVSIVGAELEYIDFGSPTVVSGIPPLNMVYVATNANVHEKATALSALVYAPLPSSLFSLYGKVGVARLQTSVHASAVFRCTTGPCPLFFIAIPSVSTDETDTRFAYGAGAQLKFTALSVRLEYERIDASGGNPDLLSLGLAWTF